VVVVAGWAGLVAYYDVEGAVLECWKLSTCERRIYPRDRSFCERLRELFREVLELPLVEHETHEDGVNVYILIPAGRGGAHV